MRQEPYGRSEFARERRIELYIIVQASIIITISNHRYSRDGGYRGETEHESSQTTPTAATRLKAEAAAVAGSTIYTTVTSTTTITTTTNNNTRSNNRACSDVEAEGLRARPTPLPLTTERFLQPRRLDPSSLGASHHRHIQLQRHCGVSSGTRLVSKTQILPVLHTVNRQTTQRPIVQLTGDQDPARASSPNSQH